MIYGFIWTHVSKQAIDTFTYRNWVVGFHTLIAQLTHI
jgi:hypothetical protein